MSAEEVTRLRHEAEQLRRAAHPGVVEVGRFHDDDATIPGVASAGPGAAAGTGGVR